MIGGYGLFGIVLDATIEIMENAIYEPGRRVLYYEAFPAVFDTELAPNPYLGLLYGHLSTVPESLLHEMLLYTYELELSPMR